MADLGIPGLPPAPASTDNSTVILWVVAVLFVGLVGALVQLKRKMDENEAECRKQNQKAQDKSDDANKQIAGLYEEAIKATAARETKLVEVVERNTAAWDAFREDIGSGGYRAMREANKNANRDPTSPH